MRSDLLGRYRNVSYIYWLGGAALCLTAAIASELSGYIHWRMLGLAFVGAGGALCLMGVGSAGLSARSAAGQWQIAPVSHRSNSRRLLYGVMLLHVVGAVVLLQFFPGHVIDVFNFQQDASAALVKRTNPYTLTHPSVYLGWKINVYSPGWVVNNRVQVGSPYPPFTLLFALPGYLLGDIRYVYIAAVVIAAWLMAGMYNRRRDLIVALLLLANPLTFYIEVRGWTESSVLLMACATVYASLRRRWWMPLALGLFFASKQYSVLAIPLVWLLLERFSWRAYARLLAQSLAVAVAVTAPIALWNVRAFWHDVVLFQLAQPFRTDAMTFAALHHIPLSAVLVAVAATTAWCVATLYKLKGQQPAMFAASFALVLLVFVCLNKQAFPNYYFLIAQMLWLAVCAAAPSATAERKSSQSAAMRELVPGPGQPGVLTR